MRARVGVRFATDLRVAAARGDDRPARPDFAAATLGRDAFFRAADFRVVVLRAADLRVAGLRAAALLARRGFATVLARVDRAAADFARVDFVAAFARVDFVAVLARVDFVAAFARVDFVAVLARVDRVVAGLARVVFFAAVRVRAVRLVAAARRTVDFVRDDAGLRDLAFFALAIAMFRFSWIYSGGSSIPSGMLASCHQRNRFP